ncbi:hypothetical protein LDENG_00033390, partial [Lucifuga dentata]
VPGVTSLPQCVAVCCDLPGYDLAWLFEGRCYVLSCQQRANCQPRERPGADSYLVFLRRAPPQTLLLQSLVRGEPYTGRWRPLSRSPEAPGDLEALKDLALFDGQQRDILDVDYSERSQEERGRSSTGRGGVSDGNGGGSKAEASPSQPALEERDGFNQSEGEDDPGRRLTESSVDQKNVSTVGNGSQADWDRTSSPPEKTMTSMNSGSVTPSPWKPMTDSAQQDQTGASLPTSAPPHWLTTTPRAPPTETAQPLKVSLGGPVETTSMDPVKLEVSVHPEPTTGSVQSDTTAPSTARPPALAVTSDPTNTSPVSSTPTDSTTASAASAAEPVSEVRRSNSAPVAVVGPDRKLFLPVISVLLDGSGSTDDKAIISYRWDTVSGPPGLKLEAADTAVAIATGLRVGRYTFRLTVADQEGSTDSASLTVRVVEARSLPPVAHASGSHSLTLPNNSLILRGSVTDGDQSDVAYLWVRDHQSPAAGDVLYGSENQASLYLANLVEGTYLFRLRVTDAQSRSSTATATVEVRPEPGGGEELELEMLVSVSQISVSQRDMLLRQLAALLHVLDSDIQVRALQGHSHLSTVLRFSVRGPEGPISGSRLVGLLRNQLLQEKTDYLLFRVLRVDTVVCLLSCSGRGQCDPITKECACDPFWTENLIRRFLGDGESNCEWRVLYVILTSFILIIFILTVSWTFICCCRRRRQTKVRKKTKYTILDNMDEQERVELRPKFSIKHRSTEHNSSLMMSESELDSDQDTIFSRDRSVRSRNRLNAQAARNGNAFG